MYISIVIKFVSFEIITSMVCSADLVAAVIMQHAMAECNSVLSRITITYKPVCNDSKKKNVKIGFVCVDSIGVTKLFTWAERLNPIGKKMLFCCR